MKTRKGYILFFGLLLFLSEGKAQDTNILDEYLLIAARNNPGLKARFNTYMAALEKVSQKGALPDPKLTFGYFINPVETRLGPQRANIGLSQSFPWFGSIRAGKDVASELAQAEYEAFENYKSNLYFEIKEAYYQYYFMEKAIDITRENLEILRIFKNLSLVKIEAGTASLVDELRVQMELNDLENRLALFIDSRNLYQTKFNNLLNRDYTVQIMIPEQLPQESLPFEHFALLDSIYANNHDIKLIDHKLKAFMNQEIAAQKEGMPKFNLGVNYIIVGKQEKSMDPNSGNDALLFPSFGISVPIYRKKYKAMIKEASYLQKAEIEKKDEKRNMLYTLFKETYKDLDDSKRRIYLNNRQSGIAKKVLDILITSYSTNSKDFEEVLRIERQLLGYKLEEQKAIIDNNASVAFMEYLLGQ